MAKETLEELRERLLRQPNVQQIIQVRAYEIYRMRGGQPGHEAQDWFHAEGEVLAFLIAEESRLADMRDARVIGSPSQETHGAATAPKKPKARGASPGKQASQETTATKRVTSKESIDPNPKRTRKPSKPKGLQ
ncbi:MAG TPA: DUF2934 domain-containing protein [Blastocatellia bacterium]|nr:DUF2934 domain-containing protein [Blastocatellia bacterium]